MTIRKSYRRYSPEFKREAIKRAFEEGVTDVAVCRELGIRARQFRRWRDELHLLGQDAFPGQGRSRDDEVTQLAKVTQKRDFLKQAAVFFARESKSGYFAWRSRPESDRAKADRELSRVIRRLHVDSKGVYGSPRIRADLHDEGFKVGRNRVARLMREAGLRGCPTRRFRVKSNKTPDQLVSSNLLAQNFHAERADERWASDITYIHTTRGWLFLAIVLDLYSRRIVGWSMDRTMNRYLVIDALRMAIGCRQPAAGL